MPSDDDEADDEELAEIIRDRQARTARAKGSNVPLLLDPKMILDFIDLWHKDSNTPLPDMNLTPGQSHVLTAFIGEEKWKYDQARSLKKAQYKKQRYLKDNVLNLSPEQLLALQAEINKLSKDFEAYKADWKGAKVRFVNLTKTFTSSVAAPVHIEVILAEASAPATKGNASTADEN